MVDSIQKIYLLNYIETPRLIIRPVQLGDEVELNQAVKHSLRELQRWMPWSKDPRFATTKDHIERGVYNWRTCQTHHFPMVVIHKESNRIISGSGFNEKSDITKPFFEIGYWIDTRYQGQGLVTELVNALTRYALQELQATRVQISTQIQNNRSIQVAKRCNFICEATLKHNCLDCISGKPESSYLFACYDAATLPELNVNWELHPQIPEEKISAPPTKSSVNPITLPLLKTNRLILRCPELKDAKRFQESLQASIPEVSPWFTWAKPDTNLEQIKNHIQEAIKYASDIRANDHLFFIVLDAKHDRFLGEIWYKVFDWDVSNLEINYWFDTRYTGFGFATEAAFELVQYAFTHLSAKRVQVKISETNTRSLQLAKRLGFQYEGSLKNSSRNFKTNEVSGSELFSITNISQLNSFKPRNP